MVAPCPPLETVVWHDLFLGRPRSRRYPKFNIRRDIPRDFPPMEKTHCRISIGTMEEMRRACDVFAEVLDVAATDAAGGAQ